MSGDRLRAGVALLGLSAVALLLATPVGAGALFRIIGLGLHETFPSDRLLDLARNHAMITAAAVVPAVCVGIMLGILITRPSGRALKPLTDTVVAASQAVPPVVVVALAFPVLGFGTQPTVLALVIYCIMPVFRATAAALEATSGDVAEAARAMGLTPGQILWQVELPLALPVIAEALRVSFILGIATAAVGALAGASTLGTPIIIGLQNQNEIYIVQGAAATGALALFVDALLILAFSRIRTRSAPSGPLAEMALAPK